MNVFSILFILSSSVTSQNLWGFSTSAVQIEGSWNVSRGLSVWDTFLHSPDANPQFANTDTTADFYNRYKSDLSLLASLKVKAYRFSFSWPRILPNCTGAVNEEGIKYYSDMLDILVSNGIEPIGTMYHWDLPQACQDRYGGWTNRQIVEDFKEYALVLSSRFSNRIRYWLTVNEPHPICVYGYNNGQFAPGVKMGRQGEYLCTHYSILAHATAVRAIKQTYPDSKFSLPVVMGFAEPLNPSNPKDVEAADRSLVYSSGLYIDPITNGDYPAVMKTDPVLSPYLQTFTPQEQELIKGTMDFMAVNYYTSSYVYFDGSTPDLKGEFQFTNTKNGVPIGPTSGISWQSVYPQGLRSLLAWLHKRYPMDVWVTELGYAGPNEDKITRDEIIHDASRVEFFKSHLQSVTEAIELDKIPVKAMMMWSFLDNWEWQFGFMPRFGVVGVDYNNGTLDRYVKDSGHFLTDYFTSSPYWNIKNVPLNPTVPTPPVNPNNPNIPSKDPSKDKGSTNEGMPSYYSFPLMMFLFCIAMIY